MAYFSGTSRSDWLNGTDRADIFSIDGGNDTVHAGGGDDVVYAHTGNNWLYGEGGNDTLYGGYGIDHVFGGSGNDVLYAGDDTAVDTLEGGTGNDTYWINSYQNLGTDVVIERPGEGIDTVIVKGSYALQANVENLVMQDKPVYERYNWTAGIGNELNNQITGNSFANQLQGGDGNDTLWGGGGNDTILGGNGNDWLYGGAGDDYLLADAGTDHLQGGAGRDLFGSGWAFQDGVVEHRVAFIDDFQTGQDSLNVTDPWHFTGAKSMFGGTELSFTNGEDSLTMKVAGLSYSSFSSAYQTGHLGDIGIGIAMG